MTTTLDMRLAETNRRHIFERLGVELGNKQPNAEGWINGLRKPAALGEDRNPSFSVNLQTGGVKDFGSDYSNDLAGLVKDVRGCTFPEATEWIASQTGQLPERACVAVNRPNVSLPVLYVDYALDACERLLTASDKMSAALLTYVRNKRGLSDEAIRNRGLGLVELGARTWLHIPFRSDGHVVSHYKLFAFDCRAGTWQRDKDGKKVVQTRGETVLYMIEQAMHFPDKPVVLCEGELDAILGRQYGFNTITGTGGAGTFKPEWADEIKSLPQSGEGITIAYDADDSGRAGTRKAAGFLSAAGVPVRIATLPEERDVSDVLGER